MPIAKEPKWEQYEASLNFQEFDRNEPPNYQIYMDGSFSNPLNRDKLGVKYTSSEEMADRLELTVKNDLKDDETQMNLFTRMKTTLSLYGGYGNSYYHIGSGIITGFEPKIDDGTLVIVAEDGGALMRQEDVEHSWNQISPTGIASSLASKYGFVANVQATEKNAPISISQDGANDFELLSEIATAYGYAFFVNYDIQGNVWVLNFVPQEHILHWQERYRNYTFDESGEILEFIPDLKSQEVEKDGLLYVVGWADKEKKKIIEKREVIGKAKEIIHKNFPSAKDASSYADEIARRRNYEAIIATAKMVGDVILRANQAHYLSGRLFKSRYLPTMGGWYRFLEVTHMFTYSDTYVCDCKIRRIEAEKNWMDGLTREETVQRLRDMVASGATMEEIISTL